jgi:hypothetical protein
VAFLNDSAAPLLKGSYDDGTGRQLYRAVGGLTALAGICAYDADLQGVAQRYFFHSLRMAKASGDRGFGGYVVALLANQALYLGLHRQVIQYAETALRGAQQYLTPALVTDLNTLQAKAYARMGDRAGCHASMRRSEEMASRIRPGDEPPETGYVQPGLVDVQHADALARLGDLTAARGYAERAVAGADECHLRGQVHRLATLATILAGQGEADTRPISPGRCWTRRSAWSRAVSRTGSWRCGTRSPLYRMVRRPATCLSGWRMLSACRCEPAAPGIPARTASPDSWSILHALDRPF